MSERSSGIAVVPTLGIPMALGLTLAAGVIGLVTVRFEFASILSLR